jgi:uncharacterized protein involved in copper resistance
MPYMYDAPNMSNMYPSMMPFPTMHVPRYDHKNMHKRRHKSPQRPRQSVSPTRSRGSSVETVRSTISTITDIKEVPNKVWVPKKV